MNYLSSPRVISCYTRASLLCAISFILFNFSSRLVQAQKLDPSFTPPEILRKAFVMDMMMLPDGRILVAGDISKAYNTDVTGLARLNPDGTLDETFFFNPTVPISIRKIGLLNNGNILVSARDRLFLANSLGQVLSERALPTLTSFVVLPNDLIVVGGENFIRRLNSDLTEDESFELLNLDGWVSDMKIQDDNIIVAGDFSTIDATNHNDLARISFEGMVDPSFDTGTGTEDYIGSITIQPDGKILLGDTYINSFNGESFGGLARLNEDGSVDNSFFPISLNGPISRVVHLNDKLLVTGFHFDGLTTKERFLRLDINGQIDLGFSPIALGVFEGGILALPTPSGQIIVANTVVLGNRFNLSMISFDGIVDNEFKPEILQTGGVNSGIMQDGKLLIGGDFLKVNGLDRQNIALLNTDGSVDDLSFDPVGVVGQISPGSQNDFYISTFDDFIKMSEDGTIDHSFQFTQFKDLFQVGKFRVLPDEKIIAAGPNNVYRLNTDGSEDMSFDIGTGIDDIKTTAYGVDIQSDNKVIFGSLFNSFNGHLVSQVVRLNTDGSVDETFDVGNGSDGFIEDLLVTDNDEIIIVGTFRHFNDILLPVRGLVKLTSNGSVDESFLANIENSNFPSPDRSIGWVRRFKKKFLIRNFSSGLSVVDNQGFREESFDVPANLEIHAQDIVEDNKFLYVLQSDPFNSSAIVPISKSLINDIPSIEAYNGAAAFNEDQPYTFDINYFDIIDSDNSFPDDFQLVVHPGSNYSVSSNSITPAANYNGILNVSVLVTDGLDESAPLVINLQVTPVNDPPKIISVAPDLSTFQGQPFELTRDQVAIDDPDNDLDDFSLLLTDGENYHLSNNVIIPASSFAGLLEIEFTISDGLDNSEPFTFNLEVIPVTGLERSLKKQIKLVPNPSHDFVILSNNNSTLFEVTVTDLLGRQVLAQSIRSDEDQLNLIDLPAGVYIVIVRDHLNIVAVEKLWKR